MPTSHPCIGRLRSRAGRRYAGGERATRRRRGHRDLGRPGRRSRPRCDPWLCLRRQALPDRRLPRRQRTEAWDITNRGDVIGYYSNADGRLHGFRLGKRGKYKKFDDPDRDLENDLTGGNDRGVTVGSLLRYDPTMGEDTVICGTPAAGSTFLRERDGTFTRLPDVSGAVQTIHIGLNNRGQTAATAAFLSADGAFVTLRAFRYDDGEPTRIAVPGAVSTFATAINDRGHIVGYYTDPAPGTTGPSAAAAAADGAAGMPMGLDPLGMMDFMLP
jgi:hypothetical protein